MTLSITPIAADVYVAPQVDPQSMADIARAGIRAIINNRPDFEGGPGQPTHAQIEAAATAAGLEVRHLPVSPGQHSADEIARMAALLAELPRPLLMFCRSGARSTRLYQAASTAP